MEHSSIVTIREASVTHQESALPTTGQRTQLFGPSLRRIVKPLAVFILLIGAWQLVAEFANIAPSYVLPTPASVGVYIPAHFAKLMEAEGTTAEEMLLGFALALFFGIGLALVITQVRIVGDAILPLVVTTQVIPAIAIAPLLVLLFGAGILPRVLVAFVVSFFPIVINTIVGLRSLDGDMLNLSKSLRTTRVQHLRYFAIPVALPYIFAGARIGVTLSLIGAVVGEFVTSNSGLGYLVLQGESLLSAQQVFGALVFLAITGILAFSIVQLVARITIPWATHAEAQQ